MNDPDVGFEAKLIGSEFVAVFATRDEDGWRVEVDAFGDKQRHGGALSVDFVGGLRAAVGQL